MATDVAPCEAAVGLAIALFEQGVPRCEQRTTRGAVSLFAALDAAVAVATTRGLKGVADDRGGGAQAACSVKVKKGAVRILVGRRA